MDTDFKIVGTSVDIELLVGTELTPADGRRAGEGTVGGSTWTLSSWDTLNTWPAEKGSILGIDELPPEVSIISRHIILGK